MRFARLLCVSFLIATIWGCSSKLTVNTDFDRDADFSAYKTWNWLPGDPPETGDRRLDAPEVRERIRRVIEEELTAAGYPMSTDQPDLYVIYHVALDQEINPRNISNYYLYMDYMIVVPGLASSQNDVWDVGTLLIDVFDAGKKELIWRGTSKSKFNAQAGPRENEPIIRKAVRETLDRFPPE